MGEVRHSTNLDGVALLMNINKFYKFNGYAAEGSPYKAYSGAGAGSEPVQSFNLLDGNDDPITDGNDDNITVGGL